jgi:formate dehydrogenase iron-sulfur subunit
MTIDRREFLALAGAAGACLLAAPRSAAGATGRPASADAAGMLVDTTRCVGCRACEAACSEANALSTPAMAGQDAVFERTRRTDSRTYTVVNRYAGGAGGDEPRFVKTQCLHCVDPACASACLVKALQKTPEGPVVYHADRCIGCRYCMVACPFGVPKYEYEKPLPSVQKCTFCAPRQAKGLPPACAEVCPSGALTFGKRSELLEMAKTRVYQSPERFVHHVYGEHENGGTSWLYITDTPFERLGFRMDVPMSPTAGSTWSALAGVPFVLMLGPPLLMGLYTFAHEKQPPERARAEHESTEEGRHA